MAKLPNPINVWIQPLARKGRCPICKKSTHARKENITLYAAGEYINGKWRKAWEFCDGCWFDRTDTNYAKDWNQGVFNKLRSFPNLKTRGWETAARSGYRIPFWMGNRFSTFLIKLADESCVSGKIAQAIIQDPRDEGQWGILADALEETGREEEATWIREHIRKLVTRIP